jgi:D-alanyl-D-alanine dipeptidase
MRRVCLLLAVTLLATLTLAGSAHAAERLSAAQVALRGLLQQAMAAGGFAGISTEWWHFDHGPREHVRREFPLVE